MKTKKLNNNLKFKINNYPHGFTLIEALLSIAIMALLSRLAVAGMLSFQKDSKLESFTREFESALQTAKNKSVNGEIPQGFDLSVFDPDYLPHWQVQTESNKYSLFSSFKLASGTDAESDRVETQFGSGNSITPLVLVNFERLTGKTTAQCFTLLTAGFSKQSYVLVNNNGDTRRVGVCP